MKINFLLPLLFLLMGTLLKGVPMHGEDLEERLSDNIQAEQGRELHLRQATEGGNDGTIESHEQANEDEPHEPEGMITSSQAQNQVGMLKEEIASWHQRLSQRENYYKAQSAFFRARKDKEKIFEFKDQKRRADYLNSLAERQAQLAEAAIRLRGSDFQAVPSWPDPSSDQMKSSGDEIGATIQHLCSRLGLDDQIYEQAEAKKYKEDGAIIFLKKDLWDSLKQLQQTKEEAIKAYDHRDNWNQEVARSKNSGGVSLDLSKDISSMSVEEIESQQRELGDVLRADQQAYTLHEFAQEAKEEADIKMKIALAAELSLAEAMITVVKNHHDSKTSFDHAAQQSIVNNSALDDRSAEPRDQGIELEEVDMTRMPLSDEASIVLISSRPINVGLQAAVNAGAAYQDALEASQKYKTAKLRWGRCVANLCTTYQENSDPHQYMDYVRAADADLVGLLWVGNSAQVTEGWDAGFSGASCSLLSENKLRQYRPVSFKKQGEPYKANYEWKTKIAEGWKGNAHLSSVDITTQEALGEYKQKWLERYPPRTENSSVANMPSAFDDEEFSLDIFSEKAEEGSK